MLLFRKYFNANLISHVRFFASWQNFKENNPVVNKFVDYRVKYEESDNPVVRGARIVTDKVQVIFIEPLEIFVC